MKSSPRLRSILLTCTLIGLSLILTTSPTLLQAAAPNLTVNDWLTGRVSWKILMDG